MGTLAAGIAHEINSPLQVITGRSESLARRQKKGSLQPDDLLKELEIINRNGFRVAEIVRSLLTYARPSAGIMEKLDLNTLVREILVLIEHQLKSWSNITILTRLAPDLPEVECDREKIFQVLFNLVTNARDAMPEGGDITIRTNYDEETDFLVCDVIDNGPGIPPEIRSRIFDPFFTTKTVGKGTGLGLSISQSIIQSHGGTLLVTGEGLSGAAFSFRLPRTSPLGHSEQATQGPTGRFDSKY